MEEIQSDWGAAGRKDGFNNVTPALQAEYDKLADRFRGDRTDAENSRVRELEELGANSPKQRIPSAPFVGKTDAWVSLALKRVIKLAVDGGYDKVAFVNGEQSAERYSLSSQVNSIEVIPRTNAATGEKTRAVWLDVKDSGKIKFAVDKAGLIENSSVGWDGKPLEEVIGKEMAKRVMETERGVLSGLDLKVGGEGMKKFYNAIVPSVTKDVLRKLGGGQMETVSIPQKGPNGTNTANRSGLVRRRE